MLEWRAWRAARMGPRAVAGFLGLAAAWASQAPPAAAWASQVPPAAAWASQAPSAAAAAGSGTSAAAAARRAVVAVSAEDLFGGLTLPDGSWVPLAVTVKDRGRSSFEGDLAVAGPPGGPPAGDGCLANGPTTSTCVGGTFGTAPTPGAPREPLRQVVPIFLAAGTAKTFYPYVWAAGSGRAHAYVLGRSGLILASASTWVEVSSGLAGPAVLVVTDARSDMSSFGELSLPSGAPAQVLYLSPSQLPPNPVPLAAFRAVAIDEAGTAELRPAQAQAIASYVFSGGTLVIAGGASWAGAVAGLPASLLPGLPSGLLLRSRLPELGAALGAPPLRPAVDYLGLRTLPGENVALAEGSKPLVVLAPKGSGRVVLCAFDPAAPPLATWAGERQLLRLVFAPAWQPGYFVPALPYGEAGGIFRGGPGRLAPAVAQRLGPEWGDGASPASPGLVARVFAPWVRSAPTPLLAPPAWQLGLLLAGYVIVAGPIAFFILGRLRRRELAWAVIPLLAAVSAATAALAWATTSPPVSSEVTVATLVPGGHVVEVASVGAVELPRGGTADLWYQGTGALIGSLGGGEAEVQSGAFAAVAGKGVAASRLEVSGGRGSAPAWVASEVVHIPGALGAEVRASGSVVRGAVANGLGTALRDAEVVLGYGESRLQLGTLPPGGRAHFELAVEPNATPDPSAFTGPVFEAAFRAAGSGARGDRGAQLPGLLEDLAEAYSAALGGPPVFAALATGNLVGPGTFSHLKTGGAPQVVLAALPLSWGPRWGLPALLVGSGGVSGEVPHGWETYALSLSKGGYFEYEFFVPGPARGLRLEVGFGSSLGAWRGSVFSASAFDWARGRWDRLAVAASNGQLYAPLPRQGLYSHGGTVEVRVTALVGGADVYGDYPTLFAGPA